MQYNIECQKCGHVDTVSSFDFSVFQKQGWHCWASTGSANLACNCREWNYESIPQNADDIKVLRAEYNERHKNEPGFVPSVEYVRGPDGKTRPRES